MNPVLTKALTVLGLRRKPPKTKAQRILRRCEYGLVTVCLLYVLLLVYPQPLFAHSADFQGIRIHSTDPIPGQVAGLLTKIRSRVRASSLSDETDTFRVFLCNNRWLFTLLSPLHRQSFAVCYPGTDNIIVAQADLVRDHSSAFRPDHSHRSMTSVVTHEIGHAILRRRLGLWRDVRLPTWLKEGYCEMLAGESSFPAMQGDRLIVSGQSDPSIAFQYFRYRRMVECVVGADSQNIESLALNPPVEEEVLRKTKKWLATRNIEPTSAGDVLKAAPEK